MDPREASSSEDDPQSTKFKRRVRDLTVELQREAINGARLDEETKDYLFEMVEANRWTWSDEENLSGFETPPEQEASEQEDNNFVVNRTVASASPKRRRADSSSDDEYYTPKRKSPKKVGGE